MSRPPRVKWLCRVVGGDNEAVYKKHLGRGSCPLGTPAAEGVSDLHCRVEAARSLSSAEDAGRGYRVAREPVCLRPRRPPRGEDRTSRGVRGATRRGLRPCSRPC